MAFWATLSQLKARSLTPEIMDDPGLAEAEHLHALQGLERINRFSRSASLIWERIEPLIKKNPAQPPLKVLDIATGAGDIPIALFRLAAKNDARLEISACDISPRALEFAQKRAKAAGAEVRFFAHDPVSGTVPDGYDIVISSLFLHHLQTTQAADLLHKMGQQARLTVVVNDLERSRRGWILAQAATRLLSTSHVVHVDGPLSVRAALSLSEMKQMARDAGLEGAQIERRFPCRFVLNWQRHSVARQSLA